MSESIPLNENYWLKFHEDYQSIIKSKTNFSPLKRKGFLSSNLLIQLKFVSKLVNK